MCVYKSRSCVVTLLQKLLAGVVVDILLTVLVETMKDDPLSLVWMTDPYSEELQQDLLCMHFTSVRLFTPWVVEITFSVFSPAGSCHLQGGWLTANKAHTMHYDCILNLEVARKQTLYCVACLRLLNRLLPENIIKLLYLSLCWNAGGSAAEASNLPPAVLPQKCQIRRAKWSTSVFAFHCVQALMLFHFALI